MTINAENPAVLDTIENDVAPTSVGAAQLETDRQTVRTMFDSGLLADVKAKDNAESRQAELLHAGFNNALDWLSNRDALNEALLKIGETPGGDDDRLLGQIALLQLGRYAGKKQAWTVPNRRNERLARFYRIFSANPDLFPREKIKAKVLGYKGRSGGILADAKSKAVPISAEENAANHKLAKKADAMAEVRAPEIDFGKLGEYRLVLCRVVGGGVELLETVDKQDALTARLADAWASRAALTITSDD